VIIAHEVCLGTAPEAHVLAMSSPFARLATGLLLAGCRRTTGQRGLQLLGDFARAAEACAGGLRVAPDAPELASLRDTVAERAAAKQARLHCPERV